MKYRVTCLTPTLVGDGQKLSPIDYMVWKDHVNVLDQRRIFKLLAKGPRLDGYLSQLRKAEKLDFASWGGFAQNFAGRRIPFEHSTLTGFWEKQRAEALFIPTFAAGPSGPFLPASAVRGALHTALLFQLWRQDYWQRISARFQGDRLPRRPAEPAEEEAIGLEGASRMRLIAFADSDPIPPAAFQIHLLRTSTLISKGQGKLDLGWKQSPRGSVEARRVDESSPYFCEMAKAGTVFEGTFQLRNHLRANVYTRTLRWRHPQAWHHFLAAANHFAEAQLAIHRRYAQQAGLRQLDAGLEQLEQQVASARTARNACVLSLGWGGGLVSKIAGIGSEEELRKILRLFPAYGKAIQTGLPFPKTRRIVFENGQPAALPGWVWLETDAPVPEPKEDRREEELAHENEIASADFSPQDDTSTLHDADDLAGRESESAPADSLSETDQPPVSP